MGCAPVSRACENSNRWFPLVDPLEPGLIDFYERKRRKGENEKKGERVSGCRYENFAVCLSKARVILARARPS